MTPQSLLRRSAYAGAAIGASALVWGTLERRSPVLRRWSITLPAERQISPVKILHISDLHLFRGQEFIIDFLCDIAAREEIDFVITTGDNFGSRHALDMVIAAHEPFFHLPGAFVFGSNDYFSAKPKNWLRYLKRTQGIDPRKPLRLPDLPTDALAAAFASAGWINLNNASAGLRLWKTDPATPDTGSLPVLDAQQRASARLALTGVDDPHINRDHPADLPSTWAQPGVLSVGITHAPYQRVLDGWTLAGADVILAGHTHGGQIGLPGVTSLVTNCDLPPSHGRGLHRWTVADPSQYLGEVVEGEYRSWLHVSAGLGTSPFAPLRIATRPEASIITITSA